MQYAWRENLSFKKNSQFEGNREPIKQCSQRTAECQIQLSQLVFYSLNFWPIPLGTDTDWLKNNEASPKSCSAFHLNSGIYFEKQDGGSKNDKRT
jgi:hypothetical protein